MFWLAQILTLITGLIGIALIRRAVVRRFPRARAPHFDIALVLLLLAALALNVREHRGQIAETETISSQLDAVRNYSDVAQLTFNGAPYVGGDIKWNSELIALMDGTFREVGPNRFGRICSDEAQAKRRKAIERFPRFPFSYYWLALCLRDQGNPEWRAHAESALSIFNRTIQIAGHQASHDEALAYLKAILAESGGVGVSGN